VKSELSNQTQIHNPSNEYIGTNSKIVKL